MKYRNLAASCFTMAILFLLMAVSSPAQNGTPASAPPADGRYTQLKNELDQALAALGAAQRQLAESRQQMDALQVRMQAMDARLADMKQALSSKTGEETASGTGEALHQLTENTQILQSEVKVHDRTKVESASKYPIQITGMLLSSTFLTDGAVDNVDLPVVALPRTGSVAHGSLTTTWRQSIFGLDAQGPTLWGGRSAADVRADFFGGQPATIYGASTAVPRLRTAHVHLDWPDTSLIAGLDAPLISPLEPTSYLSVGEPPMAWSGNLWSWSPQIEIKQSFSARNGEKLGLQAGLIDTAATASYFTPGLGQANLSESSKQPGYEGRISYLLGPEDNASTFGLAGYYGRQKYEQQQIDAWAGSADWKLALGRRFELSGSRWPPP